ncbi:3-hydroxyacyl-ACP dehydratase FabZ [Herpetosiphon sp. NSE202]|uniref:3-hydroxyacyl-ACP dehydratase FabZ n=1 Tax=Herpetosiphon sp. NSE202 TaxID=3351349 RepID=UPI0036274913
MFNIEDILATLPHRPPFLLIDRILELEDGVRAVGLKNVTMNEPFFAGHFPGRPVMPGVLIVEALAQVGAFIILRQPEYAGKIAMFAGIDDFRFKRPVTPGDTLKLEVSLDKMRRRIGKGQAKATVDGTLVAEGGLMFAIVD